LFNQQKYATLVSSFNAIQTAFVEYANKTRDQLRLDKRQMSMPAGKPGHPLKNWEKS
jgi:hypothetical protein